MKKRTDKGTIVGFVVIVVAMVGSITIEHGSIFSYVNMSAALIVLGGSVGIALVSYPLPVVMRLPKLILLTLREPPDQSAALVQQFVHLAERARKEGLLALEQEVQTIENPLMKKGIMMVVDGTDPELVKAVLEIDVVTREARHEVGIGLMEALGGFAPTLGIMGTVLGLIRILAHISNANELAASIAVAFTATLYGVGSANLLWLPVGMKLKRRSAAEAEEMKTKVRRSPGSARRGGMIHLCGSRQESLHCTSFSRERAKFFQRGGRRLSRAPVRVLAKPPRSRPAIYPRARSYS